MHVLCERGAYSEKKPMFKLAKVEVREIGPKISADIYGAHYYLVPYRFRL